MSLFFSSLNLFALTLYIHRGRKEAKSAQGASPWTPENGQRTPAWGLQSNPPPCLSRAVRSTVVSAERFLLRPLGMGSGGGGNNGILVFCSHLTPSGRFCFFQLSTPGTTQVPAQPLGAERRGGGACGRWAATVNKL